ncbi:MAG TPA: DUF4440 domain-containing protein [Chitinophagaceae bacterium]|nr:DUF4440 domain-containing protein [Chitinophagaceae bacterium]
MRKYTIILALLIIGCNQENNRPVQATHEELAQMNKDFAKALNAKDAAAAACYEENAKILPPNEAVVTGRTEIQKYWQGAIDAGVTDASVTSIATASNGDLGYEEGRYQLSIHQADGKIIPEHGKYIEILKKSKDGRWKSIYGIWNVDTLAAASK